MPRCLELFRRAVAPVIESLESRQMMSATMDHGRVNVEGTSHSDNIIVQLSMDERIVHVVVNGQDNTFSAAKVKRITVMGGKGDDNIYFDEHSGTLINIPGFLYGGRGNDTITGGSANDVIFGNKGDDDLTGAGGSNVMNGNGGTDTIEGVTENSQAAKDYAAGTYKPAATSVPSYVVRDLGLIKDGIGDRIPFAINDRGTVVGANFMDDDNNPLTPLVPHAFSRPATPPQMQDLGTLGGFPNVVGTTSWAWDINNYPTANQFVVGMSQPNGAGGVQHGVFYQPFPNAVKGGQQYVLTDIGDIGFGLGGDTIVYGVSDISPFYRGRPWSGPEMVGGSEGYAYYIPGNLPPGTLQFFPISRTTTIAGAIQGFARDINNSGYVIGYDAQRQLAFLTFRDGPPSGGLYRNLGTLAGTTTSTPYDINNVGGNAYTIVGTSDEGNINTEKAWKYNGGVMTALTVPSTNTRSRARGVNTAEFIVGGTTRFLNQTQSVTHAALWIPNTSKLGGDYIDLAVLTGINAGRTLTLAHAINESGQIVCEGTLAASAGNPINGNGQLTKHAFLLTPGRLNSSANLVSFSGNVIKPINSAFPNGNATVNFDPRLVYNIYGRVDYKVKPTSVNLDVITTDVERNKFPSMGIVDWVFNGPGPRYVTSVTKGTGRFSVVGQAFVTLEDGTAADFNVRFEGTTFRSHKRDYIEGSFAAISSRGKVLKQGKAFVFTGEFHAN